MFNLLMALSPAGRYTSEDLWIRAIQAFTTGKPPNGKPIDDLFRSDDPIPKGARDSLAELFNPGKPPLLEVKLKPVRIQAQTNRKGEELFTKIMPAVAYYDKLIRAGKSAIDARTEATGKYKWHCEESVFNRHRRKVNALLKRVRCEDATGKNFGK